MVLTQKDEGMTSGGAKETIFLTCLEENWSREWAFHTQWRSEQEEEEERISVEIFQKYHGRSEHSTMQRE